jgi:hypothetical protein
VNAVSGLLLVKTMCAASWGLTLFGRPSGLAASMEAMALSDGFWCKWFALLEDAALSDKCGCREDATLPDRRGCTWEECICGLWWESRGGGLQE